MGPSFALCLALCLFRLTAPARAICFDHSGNEDNSLVQCNSQADASSCCSPGDICYSNGLCAPGPEQPNKGTTPYYYDGCTEANYNTSACFSKCLDKVDGNGLETCPSLGIGYYCCYGFDGCDCTDSSKVISIPSGTIITTIPIDYTSSTSSTTSSVATSSNTSSRTTTADNSPTASSTSGAANSSQNNSKNTIAIGVGVGVGVGGALLLGVAAWFFWWKRRQSGRKNIKHTDFAAHSAQYENKAELETTPLGPAEVEGSHEPEYVELPAHEERFIHSKNTAGVS